eukprot:comp21559_c0_seq1/m.30094 comp21559_c0_seq1/g.30094  ORF comp21559_c0_seq1/g.30094 comp21559_c0_seq1/m.30094 type:complete len:494 (-) comp21559_c0_seq1:53-1534(-)
MSLADELLADLDDLDDEEVGENEGEEQEGGEFSLEDGLMDLDEAGAMGDSARQVAKLLHSSELTETLKGIDEHMGSQRGTLYGPVEEDPEYKLIVKSNALAVDIDGEINVLHKFVRDRYSKRFPELEQLVPVPYDYIRAVHMIGNDMDVTKLDLASILPAAAVMVVTVTASTTQGTVLSEEELERVMEACDMATQLMEAKTKVLQYVESRMSFIAPNLTCVCGASTAAKIMGAAGGLINLCKIPACNVLVLGAQKKALAGFSTTAILPHTGFIFYSETVQKQPPEYRKKAARLIAGKCALAARVDACHEAPDGRLGLEFRADIEKKLDKMQEPPPPKKPKPLPKPDDPIRKKRAGKRVRRQKEKWGPSQLHREANRMKFGEIQEDVLQTKIGYNTGMMGKGGSGRIRAPTIDDKTKTTISKRLQRELQKAKEVSGLATGISTRIRETGAGTASSIAFTPVQGLEIINPNAAEKKGEDAMRYFSNTQAFSRVKK